MADNIENQLSFLNNGNLSNSSDFLERFEDWNDIGFSNKLNLAITIVWPLIVIIGVLANGSVLLLMICSSNIKNATQYFIFSLASSDLLFLLICPPLALVNYNFHSHYSAFLGLFLCKLSYALTHTSAFITCLTLMSMTLDRYMAIIHPLKSLTFRSKNTAIMINISIWVLSIALSFPHGYYRGYQNEANNTGFCINSIEVYETKIGVINLDQFILIYTIIFAYILPLYTIVACYSVMIKKLSKEKELLKNSSVTQKRDQNKKRQRVLIMIAIVTILFAFSWLPIHCIHVSLKFLQGDFPIWSKSLFAFKAFAHTLTYTNSMLNPFLYTIIGNNFRKKYFSGQAHTNRYSKIYFSRINNVNGSSSLYKNQRML